MKPFDPTKPVQTRSGRKTRIICTNKEGNDYPIVALITSDSGAEQMESFTANGRQYVNRDSLIDLVNIPEKHTVTRFINLYPPNSGVEDAMHLSRRAANENANHLKRIACKEITFEYTEGEGL